MRGGFKIFINKRGEVSIPKLVLENLALSSGEAVMMSVSSDGKRVLLARPDMPDALFPRMFLKATYAKAKPNTGKRFICYNAAMLQMVGEVFEIGAYSKYRRIYKENAVVGIIFSRSDSDRTQSEKHQKTPTRYGITDLADKNLALVLKHKPHIGPAKISFLDYTSLRARGYLNLDGRYTKKAARAAKEENAGADNLD